MVPGGRKAPGEGPPALRVDLPLRLRAPEDWGSLLPLRLRAPEDWGSLLADPTQDELGGILVGPGAFCQGGRGGHQEARSPRARRGGVAHGQEEAEDA